MNSLNPSMYIITEPEIKKSIVWGLNICVDFDLRDSSKNGEYEDLLNKKKYFIIKILYPQNCLTPFVKPGF